MLSLLALLALQFQVIVSDEDVVELFAPFEYRHAEGRFSGQLFQYRLFVPESKPDSDRFPLIVWLHGEGESGDDNVAHLRWLSLMFTDKSDRSQYPFFVLAVQKPKNEPWFTSASRSVGRADDMLGITISVVDLVMRDFPMDPDRVYVSGVSSGGSACWELGVRYPEHFAAIAPLASAGADLQRVDRLVDVPVRAFHSTYDRGSPPEPVRQSVDAINAAGGSASLVEIESNRHDCWTAAFEEHHLLDWMLLQSRGKPRSILFGQMAVTMFREYLAHIGLLLGVPLVLFAVWRREKRRRRNLVNAEQIARGQSVDFVRHDGFTLVEVLVVIAIIGVIIAITLPAVQMARESSRRSSCANNLRQQAVAVRLHEETHKVFPTGGWAGYLGDPDAGYGPKQPGGWVYNILSFIEEDSLRQLGRGLKDQPRQQALTTLMESPIEILYCPSRRLAQVYPYTGAELKNAKPPKDVAKTDYAISATISHEKSEVIISDIQLAGKGTSKTVMAGEKSLSTDAYRTGTGAGDQLVAYVGDSDDIRRQPDGSPLSDQSGGSGFGGPHPGGANIAYCDGSVRFVRDDEPLE